MADRTLTLRIIWTQPVPSQHEGHPTDFGMQKGRTEILPGVLRADGSTTYDTEATPYVDKAGRQRFRGPCIQGPPDQPFLYLSHRFVDDGVMAGRGKALLAPLTDEFLSSVKEGAVLETTMARLGHRDANAMTQWRVAD